ncbi:hypothetical protein QC764_202890 [Podospora pseudoanserina]|uniref:CN hydrolase domain-containing protein n=1 Tax=Podospora pseudoanserina TaxID=2609844 RepID=A0ABR0IG74_9PEZI|nr:hypothetical protein QC764_202890 [Podospora pseudoanserina]
MKIACLQFAPQVGDVDNNLNRADAVLNKARTGDLDDLDLLVLPELAFTGYNFKSLQHISPCLERRDSGISSLWARTTALKHDCAVVVGYPEKVDVSARWPANPEHYNSALIVNRDGDTVGNYRKLHLFYTDETWALQGRDGFFRGNVEGLGNVALGICTDINPYELETPWEAFEFGFHVMEAHANVVIVSMAWQSQQDPSQYTRRPHEPDLEALVYWVQRLEPLIREDSEEEIIVVFCNRTGAEDDVMYSGTSAVLGIRGGEVYVYGVLGRGVKELLVVDTDQPPLSKLTDASGVEAENPYAEETDVETEPVKRRAQALEIQIPAKKTPKEPPTSHPISSRIEAVSATPKSASSARLPWLAPAEPDAQSPGNPRSPTRLQIPVTPVRPSADEFTLIDSAIAEDIAIPTARSSRTPSPDLKAASRPSRLSIPTTPWKFRDKASPYPWQYRDGSQSALFGGGACMTPITPFEVEEGWLGTPIDAKPPNWYWKHDHSLSAVKEAIQEEEEVSPGSSSKPTQKVGGLEPAKTQQDASKVRDATPIDTEPPNWYWKHEPQLSSLDEILHEEAEGEQTETGESPRPEQAAPSKPTSTTVAEDVWVATPIDNEVPDWYWKHEQTLPSLNETAQEEPEEDESEAKQQETSRPRQVSAEDVWVATPIENEVPDWYWKHKQTLPSLDESEDDPPRNAPQPATITTTTTTPAEEEEEEEEEEEDPIEEEPPDWHWKHEQTLPPLNEEHPSPSHSQDWADLSSVLASFKIHPKSALSNSSAAQDIGAERPSSPKSRNASRSRQIYSSMENYDWEQGQQQARVGGMQVLGGGGGGGSGGGVRRQSSRLRNVVMIGDGVSDVEEEEQAHARGRVGSRYRSVSRGRQPGRVRGAGMEVEGSGSRHGVLLQQNSLRDGISLPRQSCQNLQDKRPEQQQDDSYRQHKPSIDYAALPNWPFPPSPEDIIKPAGTLSNLSVVTVDDDHSPETPKIMGMGVAISPVGEEYEEFEYGYRHGEWDGWEGSKRSLLNEEWEGRRGRRGRV